MTLSRKLGLVHKKKFEGMRTFTVRIGDELYPEWDAYVRQVSRRKRGAPGPIEKGLAIIHLLREYERLFREAREREPLELFLEGLDLLSPERMKKMIEVAVDKRVAVLETKLNEELREVRKIAAKAVDTEDLRRVLREEFSQE